MTCFSLNSSHYFSLIGRVRSHNRARPPLSVLAIKT